MHSLIRRLKALALVLLTTTFLSDVVARAEECFLPLTEPEQAEAVWPYLAQSTISGIFDTAVTLKHGQYEGPPFVLDGHARPELRLWPELMRSADLDGEGGDEKIGLVSETSGGSGERVYLIAATSDADESHAWPAVLLGDRVKVRTMQVRSGEIVLEIIEAGPEEALCCGTQLTRLVYGLHGQGLVLKDRKPQGRLSIELLQSSNWIMLDRPGDRLNALHPACVELRIQDTQITWNVSSHLYIGSVDEISPGQIEISDVAPAVSGLEADFSPQERLISRLASVTRYTFRAGRLLFMGQEERRPSAFEFADVGEYPNTSNHSEQRSNQ